TSGVACDRRRLLLRAARCRATHNPRCGCRRRAGQTAGRGRCAGGVLVLLVVNVLLLSMTLGPPLVSWAGAAPTVSRPSLFLSQLRLLPLANLVTKAEPLFVAGIQVPATVLIALARK